MLQAYEYPQPQAFRRPQRRFDKSIQLNIACAEQDEIMVRQEDLGKAQELIADIRATFADFQENTDRQRDTSQFLILVNQSSSGGV